MHEITKTSIFLALAIVILALVVITKPVVKEIQMEDMVGKPLFPKFTNPLDVKKLEIVRFDAGGNKADFRIAEVNGIWSIPSHNNYPADAKDQMGRVAEALVDLNVLDVVVKPESQGDTAALHRMYGVVDPTTDGNASEEGVGTKVLLAGTGDQPLVDLIIGKKVEDAEAAQNRDDKNSSLYYVRIAEQAPVYVVNIDPKRFSTRFDEWIHGNLLDISTFDVREVFVDQYSLKIGHQLTQRGITASIEPTFLGDMTFTYSASETGAEKWKLKKWMGFKGAKYEYYERKMNPNEELNNETLDNMISALNDLKIVNVSRKPASLAESLKKGQAIEDTDPDPSLQKSGFYLVGMPDIKGGTTKTKTQLLSNEGDIQIRMKDGIRYLLRFGDLTGTETEIEDENAAEKEDGTKETTLAENRFLFITADFDPEMIPKPDVKTLPELPETKPEDMSDEEFAKLKEERTRLEKSNQREQDRYDEALTEGKKRAEKLSARFADWFYVISEDVYKKLHLTQANVFKPKTQDTPETSPAHGESGHVCDENCEQEESPFPVNEPNLPTLPGMDSKQLVPEDPFTEAPKAKELSATETLKPEQDKAEENPPVTETPTPKAPAPETPKAEPAPTEPTQEAPASTETSQPAQESATQSEASPTAESAQPEPEEAKTPASEEQPASDPASTAPPAAQEEATNNEGEAAFDPFGGQDPSK